MCNNKSIHLTSSRCHSISLAEISDAINENKVTLVRTQFSMSGAAEHLCRLLSALKRGTKYTEICIQLYQGQIRNSRVHRNQNRICTLQCGMEFKLNFFSAVYTDIIISASSIRKPRPSEAQLQKSASLRHGCELKMQSILSALA